MTDKKHDVPYIHITPNQEFCDGGKPHDFKGWIEIDGGRGGTTACIRCGMWAINHSLRYGP